MDEEDVKAISTTTTIYCFIEEKPEASTKNDDKKLVPPSEATGLID